MESNEETGAYCCLKCDLFLAKHEDIISKSFQGSRGRAYLFNNVSNVEEKQSEQRFLLTGLHEVCDIACKGCRIILGWKYRHAFEPNQKYKEGKYIIEVALLNKKNVWEQIARSLLVDEFV